MANYQILLTEDCNLKCKHCYQGIEKSKKQMSITTFDSLGLTEKDNVILYGGEPTLNKELFNYILENKNFNSLSIITNSTKILTTTQLKKFSSVQLSYNDGMTELNLLTNVKNCEITNTKYTISLVISDLTINEISNFVFNNKDLVENLYFITDFDSRISNETVEKFKKLYEFYCEEFFKAKAKNNYQFKDNSIRRYVTNTQIICLSSEHKRVSTTINVDGTKTGCHEAYINSLDKKSESNELKINIVDKENCSYCPVACIYCICSTSRIKNENEVFIPQGVCKIRKIMDTQYKLSYIKYLEEGMVNKK